MRVRFSVHGILGCLTVLLTGSIAARLLSGQTVCDGPKQPCYKIAYFRDVSSRVSFWEAQRVCNVDGGSLLSIESPAEQKHVERLLQDLGRTAVGSGSGPSIADGDFWIGLTRVEDESEEGHGSFTACPDLYRWTDGVVAQFRNWYFDEPSCGGEACVVMYHQPTANPGIGGKYLYQWNDDRCTMKHNFICKYKPESHLVKEHGDRPAGPESDVAAEHEDKIKNSSTNDDENLHVTMTGPSSMLLIYVIIPTIPLLLLILVALGTCCFQMLTKSRKPQTKTSVDQATLWISKTPKPVNAIEV